MTRRLLFLLVAGGDLASLEAAMVAQADDLVAASVLVGGTCRAAVQIDDDPMASAAGDRVVVPLHGIVEVTVREDVAVDLVARQITTVLHDAVDWSRSAVAVGTLHEVLPAASDALLLVLAAHRLPSLTQSEFADYWLNQHAALALSLLDAEARSRMGYQQLHADAALSASAAAVAGVGVHDYDGVLEVGLAAVEHLPHATNPAFAQAIAEDEQHFADPSAAMCGAFLRPVLRSERSG
jgi:hypothetical protein